MTAPLTAAFHEYQGYRYTVATIAAWKRHPVEAELWYVAPRDEQPGRGRYFRRHVAVTTDEAARRVERDFKEWVDGQLEAHAGG